MKFIDPATALKPPFTSFYEAWQKARKLPHIPKRKDISLREFAPFADSMQIYELRGQGQLFSRLTGSEIVSRTASFDPEQNILDFFSAKQRPVAERWWDTMARTPCGGLGTYSVEYHDGTKRNVESLVLPVSGKDNVALFIIYSQAGEYLTSGPARGKLTLAEEGYEISCLTIT